ncbi:hypothetical protein GP486_001300 [Trichoglossum hirsutum]|uniref:RRM domain-containing protein n=1 Tax=Trichoglossum hirsutum TaxID=265104 RepID=A0A9P8LGA1_9PEZI|nr:hypothetical protein GP486_001300 [Trichoglossum hirsutum]
MSRSKSKAKETGIEQIGPPYFVQDGGGPFGSATPLPRDLESNGDQASQISSETNIDVTDDGTTFERRTTNKKPKKRNAPVSESSNEPFKRQRVPGGRAPVPKRVTAQLDSEDEIIVSMKQAGKTCTQIAKRLRDEGRVNYREKTITSRYVRIMKAQAEQMERDAAAKETQWQEDDAHNQLKVEIERLTNRKWQMVVGLLRASRPGGFFSRAECESRYNLLVKEKELNARISSGLQAGAFQLSAFQLSTPQSNIPQPSIPQPSAFQSNESNEVSSPRETHPDNHASSDSELDDEEKSDDDDSEYESEERQEEGSRMGDTRRKARVGGKLAPRASNDTPEVVIFNRGLRATTQESQVRATSGPKPEHRVATTSATGTDSITEAGTLASNIMLNTCNDFPGAIPSVAATLTETGDPDMVALNIATCSEGAGRKAYTVGKMSVCGRVVPEPAATGRRLHVQHLPCWVTPDDVELIFCEFNFTGAVRENRKNCDEGTWFVDVATANDATRAVATLNRQVIMNELISVVVYRHPDMLGFNFGQWPRVTDSDCSPHHLHQSMEDEGEDDWC